MNIESRLVYILITILVLHIPSAIRGQSYIDANPSDVYDFKSTFINPAIMPFMPKHVMVGGQVFHYGFVNDNNAAFKQGFMSLSFPYTLPFQIGIGFHANTFSNPLFARNNFSLQIARRIFGSFSVGAKLNIFGINYNSSNFDLVDAGDPVFSNGLSKYNVSPGIGLIYYPSHIIALGISMNHLNKPDISLKGDGIKKSQEITCGLVFRWQQMRMSTGFIMEGNEIKPTGNIELGVPDHYMLRAGILRESARFEGQIHLAGPISLNYSYDYYLSELAQTSFGSHQMSLIYEIGRIKSLPELAAVDKSLFSFDRPKDEFKVESQFYVYSPNEKLEILEKMLQREIDPQVTSDILSRLTRFEIGYLDSSAVEKQAPFKKITIPTLHDTLQIREEYSKTYLTALTHLKNGFDTLKTMQGFIIPSSQSSDRAVSIKNYIAQDSPQIKNRIPIVKTQLEPGLDSAQVFQKVGNRFIRPEERLVITSPKQTVFYIIPTSTHTYHGPWKLVIESENGIVQKEFTGIGDVPREVEWDWYSEKGKLVEPGFYNYYLIWYDENRVQKSSSKGRIYVQKLQRRINVKITREHPQFDKNINEVNLILEH